MKLIIGNKNYSSWSLRAWWFMKEHKLEFDVIRIPLFNELSKARIHQYTESGKVPVLLDGGLKVWDSMAICEYLSARYLEDRGWPRDISDRAQARSYAAEIHAGFQTLRQNMPMNIRASGRRVSMTDDLQEDIQRVQQVCRQLREKHHKLGPWLTGRFSIVDAMYAPVMFRFKTYQVPVCELLEEYMVGLFENENLKQWIADSHGEEETIDEAEVGI